MRTLRALFVALAVLAGAVVAPSAGHAPAETTAQERRAREIVREVLATEPARGARPGIVVARPGGRLAGRNAGERFIPASLQKLPVTAAALIRFGPDHRFATRALASGVRADGSVGRLVLVGGGDPTLATVPYRDRWLTRRKGMSADERVFPSGSPSIAGLARRIEAAGITRVRGNLLADDSLFDRVRTQRAWKASYLNRSTGGPHVGLISALIVNQGHADVGRTTIASSPALYAARKLRAALRKRGIRVGGDVVYRAAPEGAAEVARVESPPLGEIVGWVNRWSANHPAELLLKGLGAAFRDEGSTAAGRRVVRATLRRAGIAIDGLWFHDGSGLSPANRMTPVTIAAIVRWALHAHDPAAAALAASLPVACRPGTLLFRLCDTRADGNLRGKTGLITDVRAMAGWVRGLDGVDTIYVAVFNRARDEGALTSTLNLLGRRLARFPR